MSDIKSNIISRINEDPGRGRGVWWHDAGIKRTRIDWLSSPDSFFLFVIPVNESCRARIEVVERTICTVYEPDSTSFFADVTFRDLTTDFELDRIEGFL